MFTEDIYNILIINAMRRFMFTCVELLLLFLIRNSLRDEPLSPPIRKGSVDVRNKAFLGEVHPMKRNDMQKRENV